MKVRAKLNFPGGVIVGVGSPPRFGAFIQVLPDNNSFELPLFVDGGLVGTTLGWPQLEIESVVTNTDRDRRHHMVTKVELDCYLELPTGASE